MIALNIPLLNLKSPYYVIQDADGDLLFETDYGGEVWYILRTIDPDAFRRVGGIPKEAYRVAFSLAISVTVFPVSYPYKL